jgi:hypothetical protein
MTALLAPSVSTCRRRLVLNQQSSLEQVRRPEAGSGPLCPRRQMSKSKRLDGHISSRPQSVKLVAVVSESIMASHIVNASNNRSELPPMQAGWGSQTSQGRLPSDLSESLIGWSAWQCVATLLLAMVVYDQGKWTGKFRKCMAAAKQMFSSDVPLSKGIYRWSPIQDPDHGTVCPSTPSQVRSISCTVGEWPSQLCVGLQQVCLRGKHTTGRNAM